MLFEYSPCNGEFEYSLCNGVAIDAILAVVSLISNS